MSINRHPEIGDDAVVGTNNNAGGSISMSIISDALAVHNDIISVDTYISKNVFINNILLLQIIFIVLITFSLLLLLVIFSLV